MAYLLLLKRISFKRAFLAFTFSTKKNSGGIGNLYTVVVIGRTRWLFNYNSSLITIIIIILIIFIFNVIIIIIIIMYISSTTSYHYNYFLRWLYNHCTPFLLSLAIGEFTPHLNWISPSTCALCFGIRSRLTIMSQHFHSMS